MTTEPGRDDRIHHPFLPDDECTHRYDGTDATYCGMPEAAHDADGFTWRVTNKDGDVLVQIGEQVSGVPEAALYIGLGRALVKLGTRFLENAGVENDD